MRLDALRAALHYAELGYPVFPCRIGGKEPLTPNGLKDGTTDQQKITKWFGWKPDANIGLVTQGLVVIDIDLGGCLSSDPEQIQELADVPWQVTPSGGRHHVFRPPKGKVYRNSVSKLAPKVDTRANGGYIVVAPSQIGSDFYEWQVPLKSPTPVSYPNHPSGSSNDWTPSTV